MAVSNVVGTGAAFKNNHWGCAGGESVFGLVLSRAKPQDEDVDKCFGSTSHPRELLHITATPTNEPQSATWSHNSPFYILHGLSTSNGYVPRRRSSLAVLTRHQLRLQ